MKGTGKRLAAAFTAAAMTGGILNACGGGSGPQTVATQSASANLQVALGRQYLSYQLPPSSVVTIKLTPGSARAQAWQTTASAAGLTEKLAPSTVALSRSEDASLAQVEVDPARTYQTVDGFGGALTDSAASLIAGSPDRGAIMNDLFGTSGAHFSLTRLPLGASDFNTAASGFYNYDPGPAGQNATANRNLKPDTSLTNFSIAHDQAYIIPLLKQAQTINASMRTIAAPWSVPAWMKVGEKNGFHSFTGDCAARGSWFGPAANPNSLSPAYYGTYAHYLTKAVSAYRDAGVPIDILSLQNEPHTCSWAYPTTWMDPSAEAGIADLLRPALDAAGLRSVKLMAWDHNYTDGGTDATFPQQAIGCRTNATHPIDAVGYHAYTGAQDLAKVQDTFHTQCPGKDLYVTEISGTATSTDAAVNLDWRLSNSLIGPLRHWAKGSLYWNLALDPSHGPVVPGSCPSCTAMITINADGSFTKNEEYYYYAQLSKFVDPGAARIASSEPPVDGATLQTVAFKNPDGSVVVVALNPAAP